MRGELPLFSICRKALCMRRTHGVLGFFAARQQVHRIRPPRQRAAFPEAKAGPPNFNSDREPTAVRRHSPYMMLPCSKEPLRWCAMRSRMTSSRCRGGWSTVDLAALVSSVHSVRLLTGNMAEIWVAVPVVMAGVLGSMLLLGSM